jgi:hypothetical protein
VTQVSRTEYICQPEKPAKAGKAASLKVQRRRQQLIVLYNTAKRFSVGKAAENLQVSRWTVERDQAFLRKYDLLSPKRACLPPFEVLEKAAEYMNRFNAAHKGFSNSAKN